MRFHLDNMEIPLNSAFAEKTRHWRGGSSLPDLYVSGGRLFVASWYRENRPGKNPSSRACSGRPCSTPGTQTTAIIWGATIALVAARLGYGHSNPTAPPCNSTRIPPAIGSIWASRTRCWETSRIKLGLWSTQSRPIRPRLMWLGRPQIFTSCKAKTRKRCVNSTSFWRMSLLWRA